MKRKFFIALILASLSLTACDLGSMFNFSGNDEEQNPYVGHYLEELYAPWKLVYKPFILNLIYLSFIVA